MPLPEPISILEQSSQIGMWLQEWVEARGGKVFVLPTMGKLWQMVYEAQDKPTVMICFEKEVARGPFSEQDQWHRVDRQWVVVVIRGTGFLDINGEPRANQEAFYTDAEAIRDRVRVILSVSEEFPINYKSMESVLVQSRPGTANVFLDGYVMRFSTANDLQAVVLEAPGAEE